jgi:hypothetical protein
LQPDLVTDGLYLPFIATRAKKEIVGESGDFGKIQNLNVRRFFRFGGTGCREPRGDFVMDSFGPAQKCS